MGKTAGLGILSWRAHKTLIQTLESYKAENFFSLFDDVVIYFSDISDKDREIAKAYGCRAVGGENLGIAYGTERLVDAVKADYVLVAQNDNLLAESYEVCKEQISSALEILEEGKADLVRMRHRWKVGEGFQDVEKYLKYFNPVLIDRNFDINHHPIAIDDLQLNFKRLLNQQLRPNKKKRFQGRSVYLEAYPEKLFPDVVSKYKDFYLMDSSVANFSDQCFFCAKDFYLKTLVPFINSNPSKRLSNGFQVPEICLNSKWWRTQGFSIAQGLGLLSHERLCGSFRKNHHTRVHELAEA